MSPAMRALLATACFVVVTAGMRAASAILIPFLLSIFIAVISAPPLFYLRRKGLPVWLAMLVVGAAVCAIGILLTALISGSLDSFSSNLPAYQDKLTTQAQALWSWLNGLGVSVPEGFHQKYLDPAKALSFASQLAGGIGNILANAFLILLLVIFLLFEWTALPAKFNAIAKDRGFTSETLRTFTRNIQQYTAIKSATSLLTGAAVALWLALLGVDYPILWGLLAFLLNFVPNIGSIIAALPAVLLALVQLGGTGALWTALGYVLVNILVGSILEPRVMGRGLGLSTLVVFLSLIFWGWVFGPVGMFLSVPLTMTLKIALDSSDSTRAWSLLLGSQAPQESPRPARQPPQDSAAAG